LLDWREREDEFWRSKLRVLVFVFRRFSSSVFFICCFFLGVLE
jgi:hypothetical protein